MYNGVFWMFEPNLLLTDLENQVKNLEEGEGKIYQPYLGRSVWEYVVEDLTRIIDDLGDEKTERTQKLRNRIIKMM